MQHPALKIALDRMATRKPESFELYFERKTATTIDSKNLNIDSLSRAQDAGLSIRVITRKGSGKEAEKRLGFSFTTSLEPQAIERAVDSAVEVAGFMPADEWVGLVSSLPDHATAPLPDCGMLHDAQGLAVPAAEKIEAAKKLEALCRAKDRRIEGVENATVSETEYEVQMIGSDIAFRRYQSTLFSMSLSCKATQNGESQMGADFGYSHAWSGLNADKVAQGAADHAVELLGATVPGTFSGPAILRNDVMAALLDFLSESFSAEQIDKGRSMLAGKQGELLFADTVTLVNDGCRPDGYGTAPFDGEGTPCGRTLLVEKGRVRGALYDGYYARKFGVRPTGSSQRGIKTPPGIGASNLYLEAPGGGSAGASGGKDFSSLLDGISRGILITELMGMHTANSVTGDFSLGASGILIENGRLAAPARGFAVAGNVLEIFRRITDIGSDLRFFGNTGAPSVRVSEISVGGA